MIILKWILRNKMGGRGLDSSAVVNTAANLRVPSSIRKLLSAAEINRLSERTRYRGFGYYGLGVTQGLQYKVQYMKENFFSWILRFSLGIFTMLNLDIISEVSRSNFVRISFSHILSTFPVHRRYPCFAILRVLFNLKEGFKKIIK
jgi:hypothetical protein